MFQKSVAIYLVLFIGVGIDPGCCLRLDFQLLRLGTNCSIFH